MTESQFHLFVFFALALFYEGVKLVNVKCEFHTDKPTTETTKYGWPCACGCGLLVDEQKMRRGPEFVFARASCQRRFRKEIGDEAIRRELVRWYLASHKGADATRRNPLHSEVNDVPMMAPQRWRTQERRSAGWPFRLAAV